MLENSRRESEPDGELVCSKLLINTTDFSKTTRCVVEAPTGFSMSQIAFSMLESFTIIRSRDWAR